MRRLVPGSRASAEVLRDTALICAEIQKRTPNALSCHGWQMLWWFNKMCLRPAFCAVLNHLFEEWEISAAEDWAIECGFRDQRAWRQQLNGAKTIKRDGSTIAVGTDEMDQLIVEAYSKVLVRVKSNQANYDDVREAAEDLLQSGVGCELQQSHYRAVLYMLGATPPQGYTDLIDCWFPNEDMHLPFWDVVATMFTDCHNWAVPLLQQIFHEQADLPTSLVPVGTRMTVDRLMEIMRMTAGRLNLAMHTLHNQPQGQQMQFAPPHLDPGNLSETQKCIAACIALHVPISVDPGMQFAEIAQGDYDAGLSLGSPDTDTFFRGVSSTIDYYFYAERPTELSRLKASFLQGRSSRVSIFKRRRELHITFDPHFALTCFAFVEEERDKRWMARCRTGIARCVHR
jgi:hypothetical protein